MAIIHVHGQFLFFSIILVPFTAGSPDSDALLKLKSTFTNTTLLEASWQPGAEPCLPGPARWIGVLCQNGAVFGLRLGRMGLSGSIDIEALASLRSLRSIGLISNSFSGRIPEFNRIRALRALYISDNQFSGDIPADYFSSMSGLKKAWLSGNRFSGPIPVSVSKLPQLIEFHVENNQFSGSIPCLDQPSLSSFNASFNKLEGEIPSGLARFGGGAFGGNPGLCGQVLSKPCNNKDGISRHIKNSLMMAMLCLFVFLVLMVVAMLAIFQMKRSQACLQHMQAEKPEEPSVSPVTKDVTTATAMASALGSSQVVESTKRRDLVMVREDKGEFGLVDLMRASAEVLGNGTLGSSYKATMGNGKTVVVKRFKEMNRMDWDMFDAEIRRLGSLRHDIVVLPIAYHYRKDEKLMVFEYQPKRSLMFNLHGDRSRGTSHRELTWPIRLKIVHGIAMGLSYLHAELPMHDLPHGNLKSSNVLLTLDYTPLLSDYGLSPLMNNSQATQVLMAYKSPEAILPQHVSPKCDVYCLGILILEIMTGKLPSQYHNNAQGGMDLVQWVCSAIAEGREPELIDPMIVHATSSLHEMVQLLHIGASCTKNVPNERLDLKKVIKQIENILKKIK